MRALKTILIILIGLGLLILILGLVGPKSYRVERTIVIDASPELVYGHVSHVGKMKEWSPWLELDKDQEHTTEGTDGTLGATWKWEGDTVGRGMQEITELTKNEHVRSKLTFLAPLAGGANSNATYDLAPTGNGTRITWGIEGVNGFRERTLGVFLDLEERLGPALERGLSNLSAMVLNEQQRLDSEREESTFNGYFIDIIEQPEQVYVGKRTLVPFAAMSDPYLNYFTEAHVVLSKADLQKSGHPSIIHFAWDVNKKKADVLLAWPVVAEPATEMASLQVYRQPPAAMAHIAYYGDHAKLRNAHDAISAMAAARGYSENGIRIEEYVTDQSTEPDTAMWLTNVYRVIR